MLGSLRPEMFPQSLAGISPMVEELGQIGFGNEPVEVLMRVSCTAFETEVAG